MIRLALIALILTNGHFAICQNFKFKPTGKMAASSLQIDTVIQTDYKKYQNRIEFARLDTSHINGLRVNQKLKKLISARCQSNDSTEYFYIYNSTYKSLNLNRISKNLVAIEIARTSLNQFEPISLFIYPTCGTGLDYSDLVLKTGQILLIQACRPNVSGPYQTLGRVRLKVSKNKTLTSDIYPLSIDPDSFYINSDLQKYSEHIKRWATLIDN